MDHFIYLHSPYADTYRAFKQWDTQKDLGKAEFKNRGLQNPLSFLDIYGSKYKTRLNKHDFNGLYTSGTLPYTRYTVTSSNNALGTLIKQNLSDGWDDDMIAAAMGNSYVETGGWKQLTQTGNGPAKGLFMMEGPERVRYSKWLQKNGLTESQENEINYIQHLFDSESEFLGTPWSNLDKKEAIETINEILAQKNQPFITNGDEARALVKTLKTEDDAISYGVRSAWKHQDYTTEQAWEDWKNGDLKAKTKAFEALFERAGKPNMKRRYYLSHLIKNNINIFQ